MILDTPMWPRACPRRAANTAAAGYGCTDPTKSLCLRHARDWLGELSRWTLYWNCLGLIARYADRLCYVVPSPFEACWEGYDDGIFIGGRGSGKGLHVDQVAWSCFVNNFGSGSITYTFSTGTHPKWLDRCTGQLRSELSDRDPAALYSPQVLWSNIGKQWRQRSVEEALVCKCPVLVAASTMEVVWRILICL